MNTAIDLSQIDRQLASICDRAMKFETEYEADLALVHPEFRDSARNLVHYLALRDSDIRALQEDLASLGLSSLGRAERNVIASIQMVRKALRKMCPGVSDVAGEESEHLRLIKPEVRRHNAAIFGKRVDGREVSIMVTLPSDAGDNDSLVASMVAAGMDIARINCGRDSRETWAQMIANVRKASAESDKECRIAMELSGPKLRTGDLVPGPGVFHVRPRRDPLGRVVAPRRLRCIADDAVWRGTKAAIIPVPREFIEYANEGDCVRFRDTRGKKRRLKVIRKDSKGLVLEAYKGAYIATGTKLRLTRTQTGEKLFFRVGDLPPVERPILLRPGDTLLLHRDGIAGAPAVEDADGTVTEPAHIACQQPEVFEFVAAGDPVFFDDGKISGVVRAATGDRLEIEITRAKPTGSRLRGQRGINFPESRIELPGLTAADIANLDFVIANADAVGLSFVRTPADILLLQDALARFPGTRPGIVVKIETEEAFNNLPRLLLTTMRSYPAAVMIARGDLAVECGWERLAELQEEILWLCEAAQLPVIWATEVLKQEARKGQPSRAEITDAAMSQRADCVMLNKGPHILATIGMLDNILRRMQSHQYKKTSRLRKLSISSLVG